MSRPSFLIGGFEFDGHLDYQGEMEITAEAWDETVRTWLNKEQAQALINHLTEVFSL